jgi:hypothetical protein
VCFFRFEIGAVVVEDSRWGCLFFFFFFFFFLSHPNSYFVRIGVAEWLEWLEELDVTSTVHGSNLSCNFFLL